MTIWLMQTSVLWAVHDAQWTSIQMIEKDFVSISNRTLCFTLKKLMYIIHRFIGQVIVNYFRIYLSMIPLILLFNIAIQYLNGSHGQKQGLEWRFVVRPCSDMKSNVKDLLRYGRQVKKSMIDLKQCTICWLFAYDLRRCILEMKCRFVIARCNNFAMHFPPNFCMNHCCNWYRGNEITQLFAGVSSWKETRIA